MKEIVRIGFGGGCHWCTEAVFQSLIGVIEVRQGYISTADEPEQFYEAIILDFEPDTISLEKLVQIHLHTHKSESRHSMRAKYLSAVYVYDSQQESEVLSILNQFQKNTSDKTITRPYRFGKFKESREAIRNYYKTDPERPFCRTYIKPKLEIIANQFGGFMKQYE